MADFQNATAIGGRRTRRLLNMTPDIRSLSEDCPSIFAPCECSTSVSRGWSIWTLAIAKACLTGFVVDAEATISPGIPTIKCQNCQNFPHSSAPLLSLFRFGVGREGDNMAFWGAGNSRVCHAAGWPIFDRVFGSAERHAFARLRRLSMAPWSTCLVSAVQGFMWVVVESLLLVLVCSTG